jgi:hypothetical protein
MPISLYIDRLAATLKERIVQARAILYRRPSSVPLFGKVSKEGKGKMRAPFLSLFEPASRQARGRMTAFEVRLDEIARTTNARFGRGNASIQMGIYETPDELNRQREEFIKRRA